MHAAVKVHRAALEAHEAQFRRGRFRYVIMVIVGLHLSAILGSVITFNASFVSMQDLTTSPLYWQYKSGTLTDPDWSSSDLSLFDRRYVWTPVMKALSYAGAFGGNVICVQPMVHVIRRFGIHKSMTFIGALGAFTVAVTPFALTVSFSLFVFCRVVNGLTFSMLFTVAGIVCNDWAPLVERGIFVAFLTGHVEMAALFTMPICGAIASKVGWPFAFFFSGTVLAISTIIFALLYRDDPSTHKYLGPWEKQHIAKGKSKEQAGTARPPYRAIFSTPVIWASWIAVIGNFFVSQFTISWCPIYLHKVLEYSPSMTGAISVIPLVCQLIIKITAGMMSDKITFVDDVTKLRLFNSVAMVGGGVFFAVASIFPPTPNWIDTVLALAPVAIIGFHAGGYPKCLVIVSRQYSAFVMSVVQMVSCGTMFVGSFIIPIVAPENTFEQWRKIFIIYTSMLVITNTIFVIFSRADPAAWTDERFRKDRVSSTEANPPSTERSLSPN